MLPGNVMGNANKRRGERRESCMESGPRCLVGVAAVSLSAQSVTLDLPNHIFAAAVSDWSSATWFARSLSACSFLLKWVPIHSEVLEKLLVFMIQYILWLQMKLSDFYDDKEQTNLGRVYTQLWISSMSERGEIRANHCICHLGKEHKMWVTWQRSPGLGHNGSAHSALIQLCSMDFSSRNSLPE